MEFGHRTVKWQHSTFAIRPSGIRETDRLVAESHVEVGHVGIGEQKLRQIVAIAPPSGQIQQPHGTDGCALRAKKRGKHTFMAKRLFEKDAINEARNECLVLELMSKSEGAVHFPAIVDVFTRERKIHIVQELCELGDLDMFCRNSSELLKSQLASSVTWQVAAALHFLHSHNICHGDLKPNNVFLLEPQGRALPDERRRGGEPEVHAKLGDMGRAFAVIGESHVTKH